MSFAIVCAAFGVTSWLAGGQARIFRDTIGTADRDIIFK